MPHYLLRLLTGGHVASTPFLARDDRGAVHDALAVVTCLRTHGVAEVEAFTVDSLEIGAYNPRMGAFDTRSDVRLYDSEDLDASLEGRPAFAGCGRRLRPVVEECDGFEPFEEQERAEMGLAARARFRRRNEE